MSETIWKRDEKRSAYVCSDGRRVTDQQLTEMEPFAAEMTKQVLYDATKKEEGRG